MNFKKLIILVILIAVPWGVKAQLKTDSISRRLPSRSFQFAGNLGVVSIGIGKTVRHEKLYLGLAYGYLPASVNDVKVHTIAVKVHHRLFFKALSDKVSSSVYAGTNVNFGVTRHTYLNYPDYYSKGYYNSPNAIHLAPFLGQKVDFHFNNHSSWKKIALYWELGTIDKYLADAVISKRISIIDILNLAIGISYCLW